MKKISSLLVLSALMLTACHKSYEKPVYQSVDEYPVKESACNEVVYTPSATAFSLWSPNADSVVVLLYEEGEGGQPIEELLLDPQKDGSWTGKIKGNQAGKFYTFRISEDGVRYQETPGIFAKAVGINGQRGAIIDMRQTDPEGWAEDVRPAMEDLNDAIIYELHWRDFSAHKNGGFAHPGKYLCLTEEGLKNADGEPMGIDHLKQLGITHIHVMPSYDFGSIDEKGGDTEAKVLESGAAEGGNYNWGYDPKNYNAPEGSYSTDPFDPACRIREFKQMVQACHKAGIRVVLDVVFNHTYNIEGSNFTNTCPGYFYRKTAEGEWGNASGCGNETASERPMMRKYMVESCRYWLDEYHLDGFRFDLMGIHDIETMNQIRHNCDQVDSTILIYGEGWAAGAPQLPFDQLAMRENAKQLDRIAVFSDVIRDALRGPFWSDEVGAFLAGEKGHEESIKFGIVGSIDYNMIDLDKIGGAKAAWCNQPAQQIAYVSCHDDMCLVDRLRASGNAKYEDEVARLDKLAQTAVLTSQGIAFIFCGEEVMRDKKGVHNSFCSPDDINAINWALKAQNKDIFNYYAGLIAIRKAHKAFRMGDAELVRKHVHFREDKDGVLVYRIDGSAVGDKDFVVVLNARRKPVDLTIPQADGYKFLVRDGIANPDGIDDLDDEQLTVAPESAVILMSYK